MRGRPASIGPLRRRRGLAALSGTKGRRRGIGQDEALADAAVRITKGGG